MSGRKKGKKKGKDKRGKKDKRREGKGRQPNIPQAVARAAPPTVQGAVPPGFRQRLEQARLDLRALYRTIDELLLAQDFPPELRAISELDADLAEALGVLDKPLWRYNIRKMVRDTEASLGRIPAAMERFLGSLSEADRGALERRLPRARARLYPDEAYLEIPGRDPMELAKPLHLDAGIRQELLQLPLTDETWTGGRRSLTTYVTDPEPYRPNMVAWLDEGAGEAVGHGLFQPDEGDETVLDVLVMAMLEPAAGPPRRPSTVRLPEARLACALGPELADLDIDVAPTDGQLVDDFAALLELRMRGEMEDEDAAEGYLEGGRIPAEDIAGFFRAAARVYRALPWEGVLPENAIEVELGQWGIDRLCIAVHGDERKTLTVFQSLDDFVTFSHRLSMWDPQQGKTPPDPPGTMLSLHFLPGSKMPAAQRREVLSNGWEVASPEAFPTLIKLDDKGIRAPLTREDYWISTACAESVAELVTLHPQLLAQEDPKQITERVQLTAWPDLQVRVTAPHPELR